MVHHKKTGYIISSAVITLALGLVILPNVLQAKTYTGNQLLTQVVKAKHTIEWKTKSVFKKNLKITEKLIAKGKVILGSDQSNDIEIKGTINSGSDDTAVKINDDVQITGNLRLDTVLGAEYTPLGASIESSEITDDTITAADIASNAIGASELSSSAIQSGDIETGDLPSSVANLDEAESISGNWVNTTNPWADNEVADNLTISGGTVNNTVIGGTTPAAGSFMQLNVHNAAAVFSRLSNIPKATVTTDYDTISTDSYPESASLVIGTDGYPVFAYKEYETDTLTFFHCTSIDCSTTDDAVTFAMDADRLSLVIGADGYPIMAARQSTGGLELVHCTAIDCATSDSVVVLDATSTINNYVSMKIGIDGYPIVVYGNTADFGDLYVVHCTATNCSTQDTPAILIDDNAASSGDIIIGIDGYPIVFYQETSANDLYVVHCTATDCSTADTPVAADNSINNVGGNVSAIVGVDGLPIAGYYDAAGTDLKFVRCSAIDCASVNAAITIDSTTAGLHPNIAISPEGLPVILSYGSGLGMVKCSLIDCTGDNTRVTIQANNVGNEANGFAFGIDNLPIVAYSVQPSDYAIRVKHSSNPFFLDYWTP